MLSNMASSLILHKRITTTLAKAKALRTYVEPLITKSKSDTTHSRRTVFSYLKDKEITALMFREIAEKVANRPGGYTRIIKLENRMGDNAEMAIIELVDYNTVYGQGDTAQTAKKSTRRRGGSGKAKTEAPAAVVPVVSAAPAEEAVVEKTLAAETEVAAEPVAEAEVSGETEVAPAPAATQEAAPEAPAKNEENAEKGE